jgi:hypothetical protein
MGLKYIIVRDRYINDLEALVNKHLSEGWLLVGGIAFNEEVGMQAMVKTECDHVYSAKPENYDSLYPESQPFISICINCGYTPNHIDNTSTKD